MCVASKTHMDSEFQVSPGMKVTCSCGWGDRHTEGISSRVLQHTGNA